MRARLAEASAGVDKIVHGSEAPSVEDEIR
jgi:hypothetical protein